LKGNAVVNVSLANNELHISEAGERQQILFRLILNIWGKPAENFAMLTNRGHEIFVGRPRSVRGK
jgi:hypothetical protein